MEQYIDKCALVAEIERRTDELWELIPDGEKVFSNKHTKEDTFNLGKYTALESLDKFIDTLEVKEVDLDFMLHEYWNLSPKITIDCLESATMTKDEMIKFAKHFFELGLKAQKGE